MSRQIDESKPLSDEDRKFLMQNGQELRVQRLDSVHGVTYVPPAYVTGGEPSLATGIASNGLTNAAGVSPQQVATALGDTEQFLGSFTDEQLEEFMERRRASQGDDGSDDEESGEQSRAATEVVRESEDGVPSYENWKAGNLKAQLGVRELSKSGNKADLAARLREDDSDQS